jgi:hypothetical protein
MGKILSRAVIYNIDAEFNCITERKDYEKENFRISFSCHNGGGGI